MTTASPLDDESVKSRVAKELDDAKVLAKSGIRPATNALHV